MPIWQSQCAYADSTCPDMVEARYKCCSGVTRPVPAVDNTKLLMLRQRGARTVWSISHHEPGLHDEETREEVGEHQRDIQKCLDQEQHSEQQPAVQRATDSGALSNILSGTSSSAMRSTSNIQGRKCSA